MESYEIDDGNHHISVSGRLQDDGMVQITVDGETTTYETDDGHLQTGACSMTLDASDGTVIDEGAVSQDIVLSDGTHIRKGAVTARATLPDGTCIQSKSSEESILSISITAGGTEIKQSLETEPHHSEPSESDGETVNEETTDSSVVVETRENGTPDIITDVAYAVFFGAVLIGILTDVIGLWGSVAAAAFIYYALKFGHGLYRRRNPTDEEHNTEEHGIEKQIEELQKEYFEDDGEIDSIEEYERRVEELLDQSEYENVEVEVERVAA